MTPTFRIALVAGSLTLIAAGGYFLSDTAPPVAAPPAATAQQSNNAWGPSPFQRGAAVGEPVFLAQEKRPPGVLYGRNGRPLDLQGKNVADYIAQWSSAARNGEAGASYKVFQAADLCAANDETPADYRSDAERQDFLDERARIAALCTGVTPAQIQERMRFLTTAARAGNHDAQVDFYMEGPQGATAAQEAEDSPARQQWKSDSLAYLKAAADTGDAFALGLLANAYDAGLLGQSDPKMSLAYTVANAEARNIDMTPEALRARFGTQMSEADFNAALQTGTQLFAACCKK